MLVRNLIPVVLFVAIAVHCGGTIKEKLAAGGLGSTTDRAVTKRRMVAVLEAVSLEAASAEDFDMGSQADFRAFIKKSVRNGKDLKSDPSVDEWGMPFHYERHGAVFKVISAGPDRKFGTKDDIVQQEEIFGY